MFETRGLDQLLPDVMARAIHAIATAETVTGLKIIVTCTYRDDEKQRANYDQGRTTPGHIITNDPGPGAPHSRRIALDIAPAIKDEDGVTQLAYDTDKWEEIAICFRAQGFTWGGDWKSFKDKPHFQFGK